MLQFIEIIVRYQVFQDSNMVLQHMHYTIYIINSQ